MIAAKEGASEGAIGAISDAALGNQVRRYRVQARGGRPSPDNLATLAIPAGAQARVGPGGANEQFLFHDSGADDPTRWLARGTHGSLDSAEGVSGWYADGTFGIAPSFFTQIYSISVFRFGQCAPVLCAHLLSKSEEQYRRPLKLDKAGSAERESGDLHDGLWAERPERSAKVYPGINVTRRLFHLSRNIWKEIQEHGLAVTYQQDANWALRARQLLALASCPPEDTPSAFEALTDFLTGLLPEELQPVVDYFEDT